MPRKTKKQKLRREQHISKTMSAAPFTLHQQNEVTVPEGKPRQVSWLSLRSTSQTTSRTPTQKSNQVPSPTPTHTAQDLFSFDTRLIFQDLRKTAIITTTMVIIILIVSRFYS
jgi:hypothetical protein